MDLPFDFCDDLPPLEPFDQEKKYGKMASNKGAPKKQTMTRGNNRSLPCKNNDCKFDENCHFAHTQQDLVPTFCIFGCKCTKFPKNECTFFHKGLESVADYCNRRSFKFLWIKQK